MTVSIKLDHKALGLILDGMTEDQKLELTTGVINTATRRHIKSILTADIEKAIKETVKQEIGEVQKTWGGSTLKLSPQLEEAIQAKVRNLYEARVLEIEGQIVEALVKTKESIPERIEHSVARYLTEERLNGIIERIVSEKLEQLVGAFLQSKLGGV